MRLSPALGACASALSESESDIVGPNLEQAFVTGDREAFCPLPVHRPEKEIGRRAAELALCVPSHIGHDLELLPQPQVPRGCVVGGRESDDPSIAVRCLRTPDGQTEPLVECV